MRSATNNILVKIIISLVAIAFLSMGINRLAFDKKNNIVTFKSCPPITQTDLLERINQEKRFINQSEDKPYNHADMVQSTLQDMIEQKLRSYFADQIKLSIGPNLISNTLRNIHSLQNEEGAFDRAKFDTLLLQLGLSETKYFELIKGLLANNLIYSVFNGSNYHNQGLIDTMAAFFAEERILNVISIDLSKNLAQECSEEELIGFFKENCETFRVPEKRDVQYLIFDDKFFQKQKPTNGNSGDRKIASIVFEHEKILQEKVAAGDNMQDLAKQFNLSTTQLKNLDLAQAMDMEHLKNVAMEIYESSENIPSYPFLIENSKILLFQVDKIHASYIPELSKIYPAVKQAFLKEKSALKAYDTLSTLKNNITAAELAQFITTNQCKSQTNLVISKPTNNDLDKSNSKNKLPKDFIEMIFQAPDQQFTKPYVNKDHVYIAFIQKVLVNRAKQRSIDRPQIMRKITEGYFQELSDTLNKANNVNINNDDPMLQER